MAIALAVLFLIVMAAAQVWTEVSWYRQVGYTEVFTTQWVARIAMFFGFGLVAALAVWLTLWIARRVRPAVSGKRTTLDQYREQIRPLEKLVMVALPAFVGLVAGLAMSGRWTEFLAWWNHEQFGVADPQFGLDASFYVFTLPVLQSLVGFVLTIAILCTVLAAFVHLLYGGIGGGRKIELDVSGPELEPILATALAATGRIMKEFPRAQGNQFRPNPGLELGAPEVRVLPDRIKLADNGVTPVELGEAIDTFNDGLRVVEVTVGDTRLDLMLKGPIDKIDATQGVGNLPVVTHEGAIVPVSSLATVEMTAGPTAIRHRERQRTVTLEVVPSVEFPLEQAIEVLREKVVEPMREEGLPPGIGLRITGTADQLTETWNHMVGDLIVAMIIVYLVMAILFESFIYPLVIMLAVPLAAAGGVAGLAVLNLLYFQPLDMLTLLGFVILIGIVVNNAILLVHQTLYHLREDKMSPTDSILEATRNRIRPIFMSTLTSVFGMLPLVFFPGAGSELYRGLGSVVVGGLSLSAVLTLLIVPPMLTLIVGPLETRALERKAAMEAAAKARRAARGRRRKTAPAE
ncbi:efflux RND transporter permease subunit [uncultured Demequina sp.]|uniref:efflux RND transporter permease subunit n=1 Tax=uncultured Demequina sp. TaxID=693499 RepID=UPI0025E0CEFA|nr:efflux RND transporter permease subunit [uncultured Demequina sp.]